MTKKIICTLHPKDILKLKAEKKISPIDFIEEKLKVLLPGVKIETVEKAYNKIVVQILNADYVTDEIMGNCRKAIASDLGVENLGMTLEDVQNEEESSKSDSAPEEEAEIPEKKIEKPAPAYEKEEESLDEQIEKLVGNGELKQFKEQIQKEAAFYSNKKILRKVLLEMSYLVAMNPGNGRTTAARLMGKIVAEAIGAEEISLSEYDVDDKVNSSGETPMIDRIIRDISARSVNKDRLKVCLMNLDPMQNKFNSVAWFRLLDAMWCANKDILFIFVVSYIEDSVLKDVQRKIDDVMSNRIIKFAPFSNDMYISLFKQRFEAFGMSLSENAHSGLLSKITEEKSDGCFYGINTVDKICNEILFNKAQKTNSEEEKGVIVQSDVEAILCSENVDGARGYEGLDEMIALDEVKKKVKEIVASIKMNKVMGKGSAMSMHMMFSGAPGTGKTAVARLVGQIFKEEKLLSRGDFYEVGRKDLVGSYIGHTAPKTAEVCRSAYGSVLFIDEAYSLAGCEKDFGREAISTLIAEMENNRDNFIVVFAGYTHELESLFEMNPGLRDRIPYHINFPNYSREELVQIFYTKIPKAFSYGDEFKIEAERYFMSLPDSVMNDPMFSNGRFARNLAERILSKAALRMEMNTDADKSILEKSDFVLAVGEAEFGSLNQVTKKKKIGFC